MARVLVGCCGWAVKGGRKAYFSRFPTIELQETFYRLPRLETARRWREEAPEGFVFCMKAWQAVSHPVSSPTWRRAGLKVGKEKQQRYGFLRPVKENFEAWDMSTDVAKALGARIVVVQTPPTMPADDQSVKNAVEFFRYASSSGLSVGWEPRGKIAELKHVVSDVCSKTNVIHITDLLRASPAVESPILYTRLHGLGRKEVNYSYKYTDEDLRRLAEKVSEFIVEDAFVLFNNVSMADDAERFTKLHRLEWKR
ncbi:MAG: DUF72 domain-containing protein [Candidatus Caldarchaeum sp.]|uniref:DUF72 domain-containing protein n=1 Tax=Caldiarchaeum subterraneum TaxID=311458 RepID=A0A7J3VSQ0_CALS0